MLVQYFVCLKKVAGECNPVKNRRIGLALLAYAAVYVASFSISDFFGMTPEDTPGDFFAILLIVTVALLAMYNLLGFELEIENLPVSRSERFEKTGFVLTRSSGFLILNFILYVFFFGSLWN